MQNFHGWLEALAPKVLPESRIGKAVYYGLGQWPKLSVFLTHGDVPLTNNRVDNAIRPFAVGRNGWLFSDTVKGAVANANLYSLVEPPSSTAWTPRLTCATSWSALPITQSTGSMTCCPGTSPRN